MFIRSLVFRYILFCILGFFGINSYVCLLATNELNSTTSETPQIIRVLLPGVFDLRTSSYLVRMRAWGVGFPDRGQPGFEEALSFTEKNLISSKPQIILKQEFDLKNLKVVEVLIGTENLSFSHMAIAGGVGWHLEKETGRYGPLLMAQLKAKRSNLGVWNSDFDYKGTHGKVLTPTPRFPPSFSPAGSFVPRLNYWVTSFGKIHRPGCSFYERGRGSLTSKPNGSDCRICGGRNPKR